MIKRILKVAGIVLLVAIIGIIGVGVASHQPLPAATQKGAAADTLAIRMLQSLKHQAWQQTRWVKWEFRTGTQYLWDKHQQLVQVSWGHVEVLLHTDTQQGKVFENGIAVTDEPKKKKLLQKAWAQFANDSFWLCAPHKVFDPGTTRAIVTLPDGNEGLLVTYSSGGVTPGDSYLWHLDDDYHPTAWQMWVQIIPIGGLQFSWEDWTDAPRIARTHRSAWLNVPIKNLSFPTAIETPNPFDRL
ncbi:MAG: hypothetical protein R2795_26055 [Saprospiraceae bacterium]